MSSWSTKHTHGAGMLILRCQLSERLPDRCKNTVHTHVNTIYVETVIRVYDPKFEPSDQFVTAHWCTEEGIFVTLHTEQKSTFLDLKYKSLVVDHGLVKPGAFKLCTRYGTNDIEDELRKKNNQ